MLTWIWNALVVLSGTAVAVVVPLGLVLGLTGDASIRILASAITVVFALDILVGLRSGFMRAGDSPDRSDLRRRYLRRWLPTDLLAVVPWGLVTGVPALELVRIIKLDKVSSILSEWKLRELRFADEMLLAFVLSVMLLATHWLTCGWIALRGLAGASPAIAYVDALYWTVMTITTVGYGDVVPTDSGQKLYAMATMIVGFAFLGYLVGLIAGVWARRDPARLRFRENIDHLATAAKYARLPRPLQSRIYGYHFYVWKQRLGYDEADFLSELPKNLRSEVSLHMKRHLIQGGELFRDADPEFVRKISIHLRPLVLTPDDIVFHEGDSSNDMYFLARGQVEVVAGDSGERLATLTDGQYFGEIALLNDVPRTATVRAITYCDVYTLSRTAFESAVALHPEVMVAIRGKAAERSVLRYRT